MTRKEAIRYLICSAAAAAVRAENWPQFRGPQSQGISEETGLPLDWGKDKGIRWRTVLPGPGHSSPVIWGGRIFLSAFQPGGWRKGKLLAMCIDKANGKVLWTQEATAREIEEVHSTNAPASPTPVTDGKLVYFYFGSRGLIAYDLDGKQAWELPLGPFPNDWGSASSPILYKDMLVLNCDTDGDDFLLAVNKGTGKQIWRTSRSGATRSWPTPFIWNNGTRDEIVVSGSGRVRSYDPKDGKELWSADGLTTWVAPTPVAGHGLLYVASNGPGGNMIMAIRPGGAGNISRSHVAWRYTRSAPYIASCLLAGNYLFAVKNGGIMICLDARTGAEQFVERMPARSDYYASPVLADRRIYVINEDGDVTVVAASNKFKVLASNSIGERCMASPAVSDGHLFIRSDNALYSIGS